MDLANIEDVERFQPFLDAINKEQKMIFLEKETKKIYWKYIKPRNMRVTPVYNEIKLEINLIIDINKYNTDTLYIPTNMSSDAPLNLDLNIQTNAKKIKTENILPYNEDNENNKEKFNEKANCEKLKLEGFTPNSIKEVNAEEFLGRFLNLSDNESLTTLECNNLLYKLEINNTKIKKLDCSAGIIYAENSKLEEIEIRKFMKFSSPHEVSIFASNSNLRTINKNDEGIKLCKLAVENTPLEYINIFSQKDLKYLNIKNTKLPEEIKNELILSTINNKDSFFFKCDDKDQIIFYNENGLKYSVCKYDMENRVLNNNSNNNKFYCGVIDVANMNNIINIMEIRKTLDSYKEITKNTNLIILLMELNGKDEYNKEIIIEKEISKCSQEELNQHNIYGKSAIYYADNLRTFKKLISSGYKITEKDLHYLKKMKFNI